MNETHTVAITDPAFDEDTSGALSTIWLLLRRAGGRVEISKDWADQEQDAGAGLVQYTLADDGTMILEAI